MAATTDVPELNGTECLINFPDCVGGDVLVIVSPTRRYHLHEQRLSRVSGFFRSLLASARPSQVVSGDGRPHFCLWLQPPQPQAGTTWAWRRVPPDERGKFPEDFGPEAVTIPYQFTYLDYYFRYIYCQPVEGLCVGDLPHILACARDLSTARNVISHIERTILGDDQDLFRQIAEQPVEWLQYGYQHHLSIIFKEAFIHVVGRYNELFMSSPGSKKGKNISDIPLECQQIVEANRMQLRKLCKKLESDIVKFIPFGTILDLNTVTTGLPWNTKEDYGRGALLSMAASAIRDWWSLKLIQDRGHAGEDSGFALYHWLAKDAYIELFTERPYHTADLTKWIINFMQTFPMPTESENEFRAHIRSTLEQLIRSKKPLLDELLKSECQLDTVQYPVSWFTSVGKLDDCELPFPIDGPEPFNLEDWPFDTSYQYQGAKSTKKRKCKGKYRV
ncbi:hypothetical protein K461DRAFT_318458 [Myriangium duriaei CBS 260.36]|uniref:BTB domain-containing protein n=1 Tax=Myriangium duriaei CBS 260.36 TaxID=1168546 RepID=A0A9P4MQN4_9PEZI|nr:hypothetical protein K461DRAFT_318458 [Myriangium duriaei CBS 260.36]